MTRFWMWLWQWALRHLALTPMGHSIADYCEQIINGSLEETIDKYEEFIQDMMADNEAGRYDCAMRIMVLFRAMEYAHDTPYYPNSTCD